MCVCACVYVYTCLWADLRAILCFKLIAASVEKYITLIIILKRALYESGKNSLLDILTKLPWTSIDHPTTQNGWFLKGCCWSL